MTWMMGQSAHKVNLKMVQNQEELDEPHGYAAIQKEFSNLEEKTHRKE